jgi:hypothetical protein
VSDSAPPSLDLPDDVIWPLTPSSWPGDSTVAVVGAHEALGTNISGLVYEPQEPAGTDILWAIQNKPGKVYRLLWNGTTFSQTPTDGWLTGKALRYPDGSGAPDSEGLTRTDWTAQELYVVAERDNQADTVVRESILRYDLSGAKGVISATHEWILTNDLPTTTLNHGLEGIAWIPDSYLVGRGFRDEATHAVYDPAVYPQHGTGLFLVGVDSSGMICAYALNHADGTFTRVASFSSGQDNSVDLTFDRDTGVLWSLCDSKCNGRMTLFQVDEEPASPTEGKFVLRAVVPSPKSIKDMKNEGFTLAPWSECTGNRRPFFWSDDDGTKGYAIRRALIDCGPIY